MNPKPSLAQCLVLHEIADGDVWFDFVSGKWHSTFNKAHVTQQVTILQRDGYINIVDDQITLTPIGQQALKRRSVAELVEKLNS